MKTKEENEEKTRDSRSMELDAQRKLNIEISLLQGKNRALDASQIALLEITSKREDLKTIDSPKNPRCKIAAASQYPIDYLLNFLNFAKQQGALHVWLALDKDAPLIMQFNFKNVIGAEEEETGLTANVFIAPRIPEVDTENSFKMPERCEMKKSD